MSSHAVRKEFTVERQAKIRQREREIQKLMGRAGEISTAVDPTGITNADLMDEIRLLRQELQEAVSRNQVIHQTVKSSDGEDDDRDVRYEIALMVKVIARAKSEIALIKHPMAESDRMEDASSELDEIIKATEHATHQILEANETIETLIHDLARSHNGDEEVLLATDKVACQIIKILEACNFQDISGQRVNKVIGTLRFVEERVLAMIDIWGIEAFEDLPADGLHAQDAAELMNGPQLGNVGITQADVDALFD